MLWNHEGPRPLHVYVTKSMIGRWISGSGVRSRRPRYVRGPSVQAVVLARPLDADAPGEVLGEEFRQAAGSGLPVIRLVCLR